MSTKVNNILAAFDNDAEVALTQYLIACELDDIEVDDDIVAELSSIASSQAFL